MSSREHAQRPVQRTATATAEAPDPHAAAARGTEGSGQALPFAEQIQAAFGRHDVSHVQAYAGPQARAASSALGARAYASGDKVAFGQTPTLHTAAHEAAHIVQQRAGVQLEGGVGAAGDRYEQHADRVADLVVRGRSAESLLDTMAGNGGAQRTVQRVVQREGEGQAPAAQANQVVHDPRTSADDLIGVLEHRRDAAQERLNHIRQNGTTGRERESLEHQLEQCNRDLTELRSGDSRRNMERVHQIAQRHGVDPGQLRTSTHQDGEDHNVTSGPSAEGLGRTTTTERVSRGAMEGDTAGGASELRATEQRTTAVSLNGLDRSRSMTTRASGADGAAREHSDSSATRVGAVNGGVGYQGTRGTSDTRTRADGSAVTVATNDTHQVSVNGSGISAGASSGRTTTRRRADGSSVESGQTGGARGNVNFDEDGRYAGTTTTLNGGRTTTERDAEGNETARRGTTVSATGGTVSGANGEGHQGSVTLGGNDATRDGSRTGSVTANGRVTNQGVAGGGTATGAVGTRRMRFNGSIGGNGSYTVVAELVPGSEPPVYELVTTLQYAYTIGLGGTLGTNSDAVPTPGGRSVGGSVTAGASTTRQTTRTTRSRMSAAEYAQYERETRAAAVTGRATGNPEVELVARIAAANRMGRPPTEAELEDPRAVSRLRMNQSVEHGHQTTNTGNGGAQANVGAVSAGGSYAASNMESSAVRDRRMMVDGVDTVEVRLTFARERETTATGNAAFDGVGGRYAHTQNDQSGRVVVIRVPWNAPDRDARVREAHAARTFEQAEALARRTGAAITRSRQNTTTDAGGAGLMSDGDVSIGVTQSERRRTGSEITVGARGANGQRTVSGTTTGNSQSRVGVNVLGTEVLRSQDETNATNEVDEEGHQSVNVTNTQSGGVQLPAFLQRLWRTTYTRMQAYDLDESDLAVLTARARNAHGWLNSLEGGQILHIRGAWEGLAGRLVNPQPEREWREANLEMAMKIARGQAITDFIGSVGAHDGIAAMRAILRNANPSHPLGVHWEWPDALRSQLATWTSLHAEVRGARETFGGYEGNNRNTRITTEVRRIATGLRALSSAIEGCRSFQEESARVEMLGAVDRDIMAIERLGRTMTAAPRPAAAAQATIATTPAAAVNDPVQPATPASGSTATATPNTAPGPAEQAAEQRAEREAQLATQVRTLTRYKASEMPRWRNAQNLAASARGRWTSGGRDEDLLAAEQQLNAIGVDWVGLWGGAWRQIVALHGQLQTPVAEHAQRPNVGWRIRLWNEVRAVNPHADRYYTEQKVAQWTREDRENP